MARINNHGGHCCGMRHIHEFRAGDAQDTVELHRHTQQIGDGRYNLEVILSDLQTRDKPQMIAELARLGYVYTTAWVGQHGTPVHLFHRAKQRLALQDAHFYNRWVNELNGMVASVGLAGALPDIRGEAVQRTGWVRGARIRNTDPRSVRYRQEAEIIEASQYYADHDNYGYMKFRYVNDRFIATADNRTRYELVQPRAPAVPVERPTYRHQNQDAAEVAPRRRLILSQFYCVFRETELPSRVFATLEEGRRAFPRALDWHERKVYSDGEIVEGPVNHG